MGSNIEAFNREVTEWAKVVPPAEISKLQRKIALDALGRIMVRTPVDTGRARSNWLTTIGQPAEEEAGIFDGSGRRALAQGKATINSAPVFSAIHIANNLPYIEVLENGGYVPADPENSPKANKARARRRSKAKRKQARGLDALSGGAGKDSGVPFVQGGFSVQAPQGMVALTFAELVRENA